MNSPLIQASSKYAGSNDDSYSDKRKAWDKVKEIFANLTDE